ncbi:MAG: hypothetical protein DELT_00054 [Desulfovibrio sp.]
MIHVLWDASDLWGPLAVWGLQGLGAPFSLVRAADVANGVLEREKSSLFFAPGGFSRHKFTALGEKGQEAVRAFVRSGGSYMGFCGGAGLALSGEFAVSLCPWKRAGYENRIQHYMSGHLYAKTTGESPLHPENPRPLFPVWWPARFEPQKGSSQNSSVTVLAAYDTPGPDFWLADLPVSSLPPSVFTDWEEKYEFSPSPSFLQGEPCVVCGEYGKGRYVLAYTHLETPESPAANAYLARLLRELTDDGTAETLVPAWNLGGLPECGPVWEDEGLLAMWNGFQAVIESGLAANMFFTRSPWLVGWRMGLPGAVCNTVRAQLFSIIANEPTSSARKFWQEKKDTLLPAFAAFAERARSYLLAERLAMTLAKDLPETLEPEKLAKERAAIFGASGMAAHAGGLLGAILPELDALAYLQLRRK